MNTLTDTPVSASCENGFVEIAMSSGKKLKFPVAGNPRLSGGSEQQLRQIELSPFGIHWPELDEDLSIRGILAGDYGQLKH